MLRELAVYIHWPFCLAKCPYCDFNSHVMSNVDQSDWLKSYLEEMRAWREITGERKIVSVFFGGGTPSLMSPETVEALLSEVNKLWGIGEGVEITLEANPTSSEAEKFKSFRSTGVNRLSIGVQSIRQEPLAALGRQHSVEEAIATLKTAASIFDRYSFDLIYARPNQSLSDWRDELTEAIQYARSHMSLYQLTIEEGTTFSKYYEQGKLIMLNEDLAIDMYDATQEIMEAHNMPAYEISNHATKGQESIHNLVYWNYGDYVGIGAGAHGRITVGDKKFATVNVKSPKLWRETKAGIEELTSDEQAQEQIIMGLRLRNGIKKSDEMFQVIDSCNYYNAIAEGLIYQDTENLKATDEGIRKLNSLIDYITKK